MSVCSWIDLILRIFYELFTNQLVKYTNYGKCTSDRRLDGKVVVITGASAGIGEAAALLLAEKGAKIVMAVRDLKKANSVIVDIKTKVPNSEIDVVQVDLSSLESVRKGAETIKSRYETIDVLVNNGGIVSKSRQRTVDGHEIHFGVNYLSHFLLTLLLLDNLKRSKNGKVVNVSSLVHRFAPLDLSDLTMDKTYSAMELYGKSKLAQVLFTKELAARCPSVKTYAIHPGVVKTTLSLEDRSVQQRTGLGDCLANFLLKTPVEGAQTILHCILDPVADQESGLYYMDCRTETTSSEGLNSEKAKELWQRSLNLVGLREEDLNI